MCYKYDPKNVSVDNKMIQSIKVVLTEIFFQVANSEKLLISQQHDIKYEEGVEKKNLHIEMYKDKLKTSCSPQDLS